MHAAGFKDFTGTSLAALLGVKCEATASAWRKCVACSHLSCMLTGCFCVRHAMLQLRKLQSRMPEVS